VILKEFETAKMAVWRKTGSTLQKIHEPVEKLLPFKYNELVLVKGDDDGEKAA
jgi:hypothetical protein